MENNIPTKKNLFLSLSAIFLLTFICYGNSLNGGFVGDDHIVVVKNRLIKSVGTLPTLFVKNYFGDGYQDNVYRPLTSISFALNYALGGLDPRIYHFTNLLLHAINSFLIFLLISYYTEKRLLALFAALIFVVHPIHTEAVSQIAGRTELLATALLLLSWSAYCRKEKDHRYYWLSIIAYFLALMAKESAIVLVGLLPLADLCSGTQTGTQNWSSRLRGSVRYYAGYLVIAGIYMLIRVSVLDQIGIPSNWTFFENNTLTTRVLTMGQVFVRYFQLLLWPAQLCADYDFSVIPRTTTLTLRAGLSLALVGLVLFAGFWLLRRERLSAFTILFFFLTISIVSNIVISTGILMAERVLYLPSMGICLLAGAVLDQLYRRGKVIRVIGMSLLALLLLASITRVYYRNLDWKDEVAYAKALVRDAPGNPKGHIALGLQYNWNREYVEAEAEFRRAVELAPEKAPTQGRLGEFYVQLGRFEEALPYLEHSLKLSSRFDYVHIALARFYNSRGENGLAAQSYRHALALSPSDPSLHQELAVTIYRQGDSEGAVNELKQALELDPGLTEAHFNLGQLLRSLGRVDESLTHFSAAAKSDPKNPLIRNLYGAALLSKGKLAEAREEFLAALAVDNEYAEAHNNLGVVYGELGRLDEARREFESALRINPDYTSATRNLEKLK